MKKIAVYLIPILILAISCSKDDIPRPPVDESVWLQKERGIVVASNFDCDYFVVETQRGYSVLRNWGGFAPFRGTVIYGDLSSWGLKTFYNRSEGYLMNADVRDYWMGYFQAMDLMQYSCGPDF
jgi:hypothetical protein